MFEIICWCVYVGFFDCDVVLFGCWIYCDNLIVCGFVNDLFVNLVFGGYVDDDI